MKNNLEQQTSPSPPGGSENSDLLALLKALFAWYISQNWAFRLLPVALGFMFYNYIDSWAILTILYIQTATEILSAFNMFLYNSNMTVIQFNFLKHNLKTLFGLHESPPEARRPDFDFGRKENNSNSNSNSSLLSGRFLQERINRKLLPAGGVVADEEGKEDKTKKPVKAGIVEYSRRHEGKLLFMVDEMEMSREAVRKKKADWAYRADHNGTNNNMAQEKYWRDALERVDAITAARKEAKLDQATFDVTNQDLEQ